MRIWHGSIILGFRCCATPIIMTPITMFATYGVKWNKSFFFVKIVNRDFEEKNVFWGTSSEVLKAVL